MFVMLFSLVVTWREVGKVSSDIAAAINGQVGSNFASLKTVKLAAAVKNGKVGSNFGSLVCDVFLCFCHFPMWCPWSGAVLDCIDS